MKLEYIAPGFNQILLDSTTSTNTCTYTIGHANAQCVVMDGDDKIYTQSDAGSPCDMEASCPAGQAVSSNCVYGS